MKAYVFHGQGRAGLEEVATPEPAPGEVRLRVGATALDELEAGRQFGKIVIEPAARGGG